jgi:hypothetical protein
MTNIEMLEANITSNLKQIEKRVCARRKHSLRERNERDDKICGVCYDCEATCKLDCVHKLCEKCYPKMDSCPFCRKPYIWKNHYLDILLDKEIDIDAPRHIPLNSRTLGHRLNRFESILDDTYQLSELLELCSKVNELVGKPIFYREREKVNGMYLYKRRQTYDLTIKIAIWETFMNKRVSKIKEEQFIDRLYHICNRIYIKLPIYAR